MYSKCPFFEGIYLVILCLGYHGRQSFGSFLWFLGLQPFNQIMGQGIRTLVDVAYLLAQSLHDAAIRQVYVKAGQIQLLCRV